METGPKILIVLSGLPATGKSSVAARLLGHRPGLHLSTDETRERLFPLRAVGPTVKYGLDASRATYEEVEGRARGALRAGTSVVILDGTYLRAEDRARAVDLGLEAGAEVLLLELTASEAALRARLRGRRPGVEHHSEADLEVYEAMRDKLERRAEGYARLGRAEGEGFVGSPVVGLRLDTELGRLSPCFGRPSEAALSLLGALDPGFSG